MTTFMVISTHSPDQCPLANSKAREAYGSDPAPMMALMQRLGIRPIAGPLSSVEHKTYVIVDAPKVEAVREFLVQSGLALWNSVEVIHVVSSEETAKEMASVKPIY